MGQTVGCMSQGFFYALIALFLWGIHGPAGRYLSLQGVDMYFVFALRFWLGSLVLFLYLMIKKSLSFTWFENKKQILLVAIVGIFGNSLLYHLTLNYLPGTLVMVLENISPIFVLLASFYYLRVKPSLKEIAALLVSFIGIGLIILSKDKFPELQDGFTVGVVLGILTGLSFGAYIFYSAQYVKPLKNDPIKIIQFLLKVFVVSAVLGTPFLFTSKAPPANFIEWFWLIEMGVFQSGFAYIFWNYALSRLNTNTASILFLLTIVFTTINEILFLGLRLNTYLVAGSIMIFLAGYLLSFQSKSSVKMIDIKG